MNLFENLQRLNESENKIISEFKEFLVSKNAQYIANEIGETKDGMQIVIYDGDWKHEHLYMKRLLDEFFTNKGIDIFIKSEEIGESDQDTFSAKYDIEFNAKPNEYVVDVKSINENVDNSNEQNIDLSEYEYVGPATGYNKGWSLYRKIVDGKGVWVAEHQQTKEVVSINYDQVQGFEPIKNTGIDKLRKDLGDMLLPKKESTNDSEWEYLEKTTTKDDIFGDINEGGYYIKKYNDDMTGIIYPPSESEKLYRAKLTRKNKFNSFGYNAFIELDSAKEFLDETARKLAPVTYEEIKRQLEEIDTHEYLQIFINEPTKLGNVSVSIEGTLINGDPITFYDSSYIINQRDIDFIKEQYVKASKEIDHMRERGYLGVKDESIEEDYNDNAATFLDKIEKEITSATHKFMMSKGFPEDEVNDYSRVSTDISDEYVKISVGAELEYDSLFELCQTLDKIIEKEDEDAYFEPECPGRIVAYLFGEKAKNAHKEKEQALKDKQKSFDKIEETNHNEILDKDYATGEEMYNELVKYLNSLDQIAMDGNDCNWEPSEFNAKNLNADGEIYLVNGTYILIYPYINEWAEDYFRVLVMDAETCELSIQIKNGIDRIFNKFKTDKWEIKYEG